MQVTRLKKRKDFLRIAQANNKYILPGLVLQVAKNDSQDSDDVRIGFTVSKKVGCAVERNRAKRRLKALSNQVFGKAERYKGCDFVVIGRSATVKRPFDKLKADMEIALKKFVKEGLE